MTGEFGRILFGRAAFVIGLAQASAGRPELTRSALCQMATYPSLVRPLIIVVEIGKSDVFSSRGG
jgi:hypothetical protein